MKVYLSCPVIKGRRLRMARLLHHVLSIAGNDIVSEWLVKKDPGFGLPPQQVYRRDTEGVRAADILVADVSRPSHGVGMEIMLALVLNKPIIAVAPRRTRLSRMLLGAPNMTWVRYSDIRSLEEGIKRAISAFSR